MKIDEFNRLLRLAQEQGNGNLTLIGFRALNIKHWKVMYDECSISSDKENGYQACLEMTKELIEEMKKVFVDNGLNDAKKALLPLRAEEVLGQAEQLDPAEKYAELTHSG